MVPKSGARHKSRSKQKSPPREPPRSKEKGSRRRSKKPGLMKKLSRGFLVALVVFSILVLVALGVVSYFLTKH